MTSECDRHLKRAEELLRVAEENLENSHPSDSISRSYYAMFHAATAVLKLVGIERESHHALWAAFGEHLTATGLIDPEFHRLALDTFSARSLSDYLASPSDSLGDAANALFAARRFVAACRSYAAGQSLG